MTRDQIEVEEPVLDVYARCVSRGQARLGRFLGLPAEVSASGAIVSADDGHDYLDCGGYGVFLLGHRHPSVVAAVADQLGRQPLSTRLFPNRSLADAASRLLAVAPEGLARVTFTNSGAEAVELALKLGRANGLERVVAMRNAFHGKTLGALSVTGRERYRAPFHPLLPVEHVPFGDAVAVERCLAEAPALVIVEPIQCEGGVQIAPDGYLAAVRDACDRTGSLLAVDEVQTGLGRTGSWWACSAAGVRPDILLSGKALGGGVMPVAATMTSATAFKPLDDEPLMHSSTFAGNPLACAAVSATIGVLETENVPARAAVLGGRLLRALRSKLAHRSSVVDVRGVGLMIGIELASGTHAARFLEEMLDRQVIVSYSLNSDLVLRVTPSVFLDDAQVEWLISAAESAAVAIEQR